MIVSGAKVNGDAENYMTRVIFIQEISLEK